MTNSVKHRSEILFCYDIKDANPNGDPLDMNKPRIDEETGINIVTDVRLKRTIRDYLYNYKGFNSESDKDIFVRTTFVNDDEAKGINDGKGRADTFEKDPEKILNTCIDIRLFGGVLPLDRDSITYTGPVQFKMGRSLHPVELAFIKGTGAFASSKGAKQQTFREEYILPYSFIAFHGIINENAGRFTKLMEDDIDFLLDGMWNGTKNLISRSKFGQMPRFLIKVDYKESGYFIGDLDKYICLSDSENLAKIRDIRDFTLNIDKLVEIFEKQKEKIEKVYFCKDSNLNLSQDLPEEWKQLNL